MQFILFELISNYAENFPRFPLNLRSDRIISLLSPHAKSFAYKCGFEINNLDKLYDPPVSLFVYLTNGC